MGFRYQVPVMNETIIISPSGNFYGSEQVLFDFLCHSEKTFTLFVPSRSLFEKRMTAAETRHEIKTFGTGSLRYFYFRVFLLLLFGRVQTVYVNEGGHSKYMLLLARFFPRKKFVLHVRMMEDTADSRWSSKHLSNVRVIAISEYIKEKLPLPSTLIYDPYCFTEKPPVMQPLQPGKLVIGIIGRITATKGIGKLLQLLEYPELSGSNGPFFFHLYGEASETQEDKPSIERLLAAPNVTIKGFVQDKNLIYGNVDCVLHLSEQEALGRIFFEAIDYGKPFIGFDAAGIKEIGLLSGLNRLLVAPGPEWETRMTGNFFLLEKNYPEFTRLVRESKKTGVGMFSVDTYVTKINELIA
ncbi:glycosyltransferase [Flavitalea flava]